MPAVDFTDEDKIAELKREIGYRVRVYGRMAHEHPEKAAGLERRRKIMEAILADYQQRTRLL